jgi:sugar phosphate isomerase/epimerase
MYCLDYFQRLFWTPGVLLPEFGRNVPEIERVNTMKTIKGPAIFLAQFAGDEAPFNSFASICRWAADLAGFKGVQVPSWDSRLIDLRLAAESLDYCDELNGVAAEQGVQITELSTHLRGGWWPYIRPASEAFDGFAAPEVRGNQEPCQLGRRPVAAGGQGVPQLRAELPCDLFPARWPGLYLSWPQRPAGDRTAFDELAKRWRPILVPSTMLVSICVTRFHPGDLHDGASFEMFLDGLKSSTRVVIFCDPSHFVLQSSTA